MSALVFLVFLLKFASGCEQPSFFDVQYYQDNPNGTVLTIINGCLDADGPYRDFDDVVIVGGNIEKLRKGAVANLPKLWFLQLSIDNITAIESGAFSNLTKLQYLTISGNSIPKLVRGSFANLTMEYLNLRLNNIRSIEPGTFSSLPNLTHIILEMNEIEAYDPKWFNNTPALDKLILDNNNIKSLPSGAFENLPNLTVISFAFNKLTQLESGVFLGKTYLYGLSLHHNMIKTIEEETFSPNQTFISVDLTANHLTFLPGKVLDGLKRSRRLLVAGNPWHCDCYRDLEEWADANKVSIMFFPHVCFENVPSCVKKDEEEEGCPNVYREDLLQEFLSNKTTYGVC